MGKKSFRAGPDTSLSKRSPLAGTMDQVRPQPIRWPCDHANVDWSTYPLQTPSGGGRAPTPYRSKTPANGMTQKGIDLSRPVTEGWVETFAKPINATNSN